MARLFTVAISEARSNQTEKQIWLLNNISQRIISLGEVSHSVSNDTYGQTTDLIELLVQVIAASTGNPTTRGVDYQGIKKSLYKLLEEYESNFSDEQVKHARKEYADQQDDFQKELENIEESLNSDAHLDDEPVYRFFEGDSKREAILRRKELREFTEAKNANKKEDA